MGDIEKIYLLLLHSKGLKLRSISKELELDKHYVAEIMFSPQNSSYWFQDDNFLWFAIEGALQINEQKHEDELLISDGTLQKFNINRFLHENISDSLRIYLLQISQYRIYSNNEILLLVKRYRNGDRKAFELLVKSQQRLIANISILYSKKGVAIEDIIQEGNIGLIKAIERFDESQSRNFINYAKNWIIQAISISLSTTPLLIKLPLNQILRHHKIIKFKEKFEQQYGYAPSVSDIAINEDDDLECIKVLDKVPDDLRKLVEIHCNLDFMESDNNLVALFEDDEYNTYHAHRLLKRLKKREYDILKNYYGIDVSEECLSSIGEKFNLTRERVRQIVWTSIRQLRDISNIKIEEAKIGDLLQIDSSREVGRVIKVKKDTTGTSILVVRMKSGHSTSINVYDTPFHILKKSYRKKILTTQRISQITTNTNDSFKQNMVQNVINKTGNFKKEIISKNNETSRITKNPLYAVRKLAILRAMTYFRQPAEIKDITNVISRTAWGAPIRVEDVENFINTISEVENFEGKYMLKKDS